MAAGLLLGALGANAAPVEITPSTPYADWPSDGEVKITGGLIEITDSNVAKVQGWTKLTAASGSGLKFNGIAQSVVFKADIVNVVQFKVINCASFEMRGTTSGYWANSKMQFTDSNVIIGNENALIPKHGAGDPAGSDRPENEFYFNYGSDYGSLTFRKPEWDALGFTGAKVFTNHADVVFYVTHSKAYYQHFAQTIGSRSADEYVVQDGDMYWKGFANSGNGQTYIYVRGNYEHIYGLFGRTIYNGQPCYFYQHPDYTAGTAHLKIAGTSEFHFGGENGTIGTGIYFGGVCFAQSGGTYASLQVERNLIFAATNTLDNTFTTKKNTSLSCYTFAEPNVKTIDLNGYDQRVPKIGSVWGCYPADKPNQYVIFSSATPATLTLCKSVGPALGDDTIGISAKFTDRISLLIDNGVTNRFCRVVSDTAGALTVNSGTCLFTLDGGWDGASTVIRAGGLIDAQSAKSFSLGHSALTMEKGGRLKMYDASPVFFATADINGTELEKGTYTVADLRKKGFGAYFIGDDTAALHVVGTPSEWKGWRPGKPAVVPNDMTVAITDADVENVEQVLSIELGVNSVVDCSALTKPLDLSMPVSGSGQFRIVNCPNPVVLQGDNSGLVSPGAFYIENSYVCVSNRYGLGTSKTGWTTIKNDKKDRRVHFGLEGSDTFVNDVPLRFDMTYGSPRVECLGEMDGTKVVQAGGVQLGIGGLTNGTAYTYMFYGDVTLQDDVTVMSFSHKASAHYVRLYSATNGLGVAHVTFGPEVDFASASPDAKTFCVWNGGEYHPNGKNVPLFTYQCAKPQVNVHQLQFNVPDIEFAVSDLFGTAETAFAALFYYGDIGTEELWLNTLRLAGHDVAFNAFYSQRAAQHAPSPNFADVESPTPGYLIYAKGNQNRRENLRFHGQAGFHFQGIGTNLLAGCASDTTGDLRVSSGVSGLDWGATWAGSATVDGTGMLYIGAESAAAGAFGTESGERKSTTELSVRGHGGLFLEGGKTVVLYATYFGSPLPGSCDFCATDNAEAIAGGAIAVDWITGQGLLHVLKTAKADGISVIFR